jgi:hypothetical protein
MNPFGRAKLKSETTNKLQIPMFACLSADRNDKTSLFGHFEVIGIYLLFGFYYLVLTRQKGTSGRPLRPL